jgi:dTDP-4-amino-4,6-dideoxygalactose transaminase
MINVTKAYLPDKNKINKFIDRIYDSVWLTNGGQFVRELEWRLKEYLGVKYLILIANGTLALQVAYKALELKGEVVTTPFSFVATTSSLVWEGLEPVFADIDIKTLNINHENIEPLISKDTSAIVAVHVYGNPCNVEAIQKIADKHSLKIIYDAAHCFGVKHKGQSILNYGDISVLSLHATKLFHTVEGGAIVTNNDEIAKKVRLLINFGITGTETIEGLGINAKMNEFEAAMGLCVLDDIENIILTRKNIWRMYHDNLQYHVSFPEITPDTEWNYSYVPVLFKTEDQLLKVQKTLNENGIFPRRYYCLSLDTLNYVQSNKPCEISRNVARRILCLPIYVGLDVCKQSEIIEIVRSKCHMGT